MDNITLTEEQLDALKEIACIGGGNAAIALNELLDKNVKISIPRVDLLSLDKISECRNLEGPEVNIAVSLSALGDLKAGVLILSTQQNTLILNDILTGRPVGSTELFSLIDISAFSEWAHIVSCAYLNAVSELLNVRELVPAAAKIMIDKTVNLKTFLSGEFSPSVPAYILPIENQMCIEGVNLEITVIFLLDHETVKKILKMLGL